MELGKPFIINLAPTGVVPTREMTPHVPLSHPAIVDAVAPCIERGVQIIHLHARDDDDKHTGDPEPYGRLIESIRKLPGGKDVLICVTTSGRNDPDFASRSRVLELDGDMKPDMASLTLSSINFMHSASINSPDVVRQLAEKMREKHIVPELEVFDLGMANLVQVLIKEQLLNVPVYVNVLLGNIASAQAEVDQLSAILAALPAQRLVTVAGLGRAQLAANSMGMLMADGVRVGLEDNLWLDQARTTLASNLDQVERMIRLGEALERPLLQTTALRKQLQLQ